LKSIVYTFFTSILVLISAVILISSIIYLAPVDPARLTFGQRTDSAAVERKQAELFLDKPLHIQMLYYLNDISPISFGDGQRYEKKNIPYTKILGGDDGRGLLLKIPYFRESFQSGKRVAALLKDAIPKTIILALAAIGIAIIFGQRYLARSVYHRCLGHRDFGAELCECHRTCIDLWFSVEGLYRIEYTGEYF